MPRDPPVTRARFPANSFERSRADWAMESSFGSDGRVLRRGLVRVMRHEGSSRALDGPCGSVHKTYECVQSSVHERRLAARRSAPAEPRWVPDLTNSIRSRPRGGAALPV